MEFFILYLLMILENLQEWLKIIAIATGVLGGVTIFIRGVIYLDYSETSVFNKPVKWLVAICLATSLIATLIPSKKDMAIIAAAGVTYNVVTSDAAKEIGGKGIQLLNNKLDEMLTEKVDEVKETVKK